jgi:hypothetical protein
VTVCLLLTPPFASDGKDDETEIVFDADCCNGIVVVAIVLAPFCGDTDTTGGCDKVVGKTRMGATPR